MELDSRIIEGKRPLTCFDTEQAKEFLGKECYFSDHLCTFNELLDAYSYVTADVLVSKEKHLYVGELLTVSDSDGSCYEAGINGEAEWFQFCLPCEWVEEKKEAKEPKYRPFSIEDWKFKHSIGETILYRYKGTYCGDHREAEVMYLGYVKPLDRVTDEAGKGYLVLGNDCHDLQNLFDNYEIWIDGEWKPFGVEE